MHFRILLHFTIKNLTVQVVNNDITKDHKTAWLGVATVTCAMLAVFHLDFPISDQSYLTLPISCKVINWDDYKIFSCTSVQRYIKARASCNIFVGLKYFYQTFLNLLKIIIMVKQWTTLPYPWSLQKFFCAYACIVTWQSRQKLMLS